MSAQNYEQPDFDYRPPAALEAEPKTRRLSPSEQLRIDDRHYREFESKVLKSVTPGSHGEVCVGLSEYFFNESEDSQHEMIRKEQIAKALCNICPVKLECRTDSYKVENSYGIWGGLTKKERDRLARTKRSY